MTIWSCSLLAVNKPKNITSAKLVDKIKAIILGGCQQQVKMGHGGTLDETATGVIVVGTGEACKMLPRFLHGSKKYTVRGCLGIETDTYNECGKEVARKPFGHVNEQLISQKLKLFRGEIWQKPPKYSALKIGGRRVADLTRSGVICELDPRRVVCHSLRLTELEPPFFNLEVVCGGGFYVRSLVHDLGQVLGTCAYVTSLHRNRHGFLTERDALAADCTYDDLVENARRISTKPEFKKITSRAARKWKKPDRSEEVWIDAS